LIPLIASLHYCSSFVLHSMKCSNFMMQASCGHDGGHLAQRLGRQPQLGKGILLITAAAAAAVADLLRAEGKQLGALPTGRRQGLRIGSQHACLQVLQILHAWRVLRFGMAARLLLGWHAAWAAKAHARLPCC
jgi:hypothetical protein